MPVGHVQQVAQPAAAGVPSLVADAVLQDDVVGAQGPQERVHLLWGPLRVDLVHLQGDRDRSAEDGHLPRARGGRAVQPGRRRVPRWGRAACGRLRGRGGLYL